MNILGLFNKGVKCSRCGKAYPPKEAYYDRDGNVYCGMECITAKRNEMDDHFVVTKGERPA